MYAPNAPHCKTILFILDLVRIDEELVGVENPG